MNGGPTRDQITAVFQAFSGQSRSLVIPRPYIDLCGGDHLAALLLSQILYWSERSSDPDGWFAKSYEDWHKELAMSKYQVNRAINGDKRAKSGFSLSSVGVETALRQSEHYAGAPVVHYRVNYEALSAAIRARFAIVNNVDNPIVNIVDYKGKGQTVAAVDPTPQTPIVNNVDNEGKSTDFYSQQCSLSIYTQMIDQDQRLEDQKQDQEQELSGTPAGAAVRADHGLKVVQSGTPFKQRRDAIFDALAEYWYGAPKGTPEYTAHGWQCGPLSAWLAGADTKMPMVGGKPATMKGYAGPVEVTPEVIKLAAQAARREAGQYVPEHPAKIVAWLSPWLKGHAAEIQARLREAEITPEEAEEIATARARAAHAAKMAEVARLNEHRIAHIRRNGGGMFNGVYYPPLEETA